MTDTPKDTGAAFTKALKLFVTLTTDSMKAAQVCANMAIEHFAAHGDLGYVQQFYDAMRTNGKNYVRSTAFVAWLHRFAPVVLIDDKWKKDKERAQDYPENIHVLEDDLAAAISKSFWEFKPDTEQYAFEYTDVIIGFEAVLKRFKNEKRNTPKNAEAKAKLAEATRMVTTLAKRAVMTVETPEATEAAVG